MPNPTKLPGNAQWTALGVADVFLNGDKVGADFLMPGWSDFRRRTQLMNADATKLLRAGDNNLGAICGDGWYTGTLLWKNDRTHYEFYRHLREVTFELRLQTVEVRPKSKRRGYQLDETLAVPFEN